MQLLLPSAKSAVLVTEKERRWRRFELIFFVIGLVIVGAGALDISRHVGAFSLGDNTLRRAFAPAATLP